MCYLRKINNLDSRIINPDQIFTNDVEKWAFCLSNLYSNFTKPLLDIVLFSKKLSETLGVQGPIWTFFWYILTVLFIRFISPPFGKLIAIEQSIVILYVRFGRRIQSLSYRYSLSC
jgi:ATP-binding cassette subfamily D (ALD) protein 3